MEEAAAGKARLPTVHSLTDGTVRRLVAAERSVLRPEMLQQCGLFVFPGQRVDAAASVRSVSSGRAGHCKLRRPETQRGDTDGNPRQASGPR